jgi:hypothetical protein
VVLREVRELNKQGMQVDDVPFNSGLKAKLHAKLQQQMAAGLAMDVDEGESYSNHETAAASGEHPMESLSVAPAVRRKGKGPRPRSKKVAGDKAAASAVLATSAIPQEPAPSQQAPNALSRPNSPTMAVSASLVRDPTTPKPTKRSRKAMEVANMAVDEVAPAISTLPTKRRTGWKPITSGMPRDQPCLRCLTNNEKCFNQAGSHAQACYACAAIRFKCVGEYYF